MPRGVILALTLTLISGCVTNKQMGWVPLPGHDVATFEQSKARCSIMARHGGSGYVAAGSPTFVAGASIGHAIAESVRTQQDFKDCMTIEGFVLTELPAAPPAASPSGTAPPQ